VTDELEKFYMPRIDADPTGRNTPNNGPSPVEVMLKAYDLTEQYDKAATLLEKYKSMTKDNSVQSMIDNYRKRAAEASAPKTDSAAQR
jgi:hypothetical protein